MGGEDDRDDADEGYDFALLTDEDGHEVRYAIVRILELDGEEYALLTPVDADPGEDLTILIVRYEIDEAGEEVLSHLDDETFARVQAHAEALLGAEDDEDDEDDGD